MANEIANIRVSTLAATAVVGYDLLTGNIDARTPYPRVLDGICLVGSAAAGDTVVDLRVNGRKVGTYANSSTGTAVDRQKDLMPLDIHVGANEPIEAIVTDAATTNPIVIQLEFSKPRWTGTRRTYRARRSGGTRAVRSTLRRF